MQRYEYKVVPAPRRGEKARGVKTLEDRFALALTQLMNELAADGWDYLRADALPVDERAGLTGGVRTSFQNMLVFRRALILEAAATPAAATAVAPAAAQPQAPRAEDSGAGAPLILTASQAAPASLGSALSRDGGESAARLGAADAPAGPAPSLGPAKES